MNRMMIVAVAMMVSVSTLNGAEPAAPPPAPAAADSPSLAEQIAQLRALQEAVKARLLGVPADDKKRLAEFLKQPDTGLIKLLPRGTYDDVVVGMRGGGAYYSFVRLTHAYGHGSDIQLQNNRLSCGFAGGDYGYFLPLGDVPIEKAAAAAAKPPEWAPREAAERWGEVWGDAPVEKEVIWQREVQQFRRNGAAAVNRGVSAKPGHTYLLRSVSPGDSDVLVAFRVERAFEEDGSVLISWKLMNRFPVPNPRGRFPRNEAAQLQVN